jgi:hypothetical protein
MKSSDVITMILTNIAFESKYSNEAWWGWGAMLDHDA